MEILCTLGLVESGGVDFTLYHLDGPAMQWKRTFREYRSTGSPPVTLTKFLEALLENVLLRSVRDHLRDHLTRLEQGSMTISE